MFFIGVTNNWVVSTGGLVIRPCTKPRAYDIQHISGDDAAEARGQIDL